MAGVSRLTHLEISYRDNCMGVWCMGVWGMVYGFRRANGVRPLWLARAAFVAAAFQLFLRCSSAMSLMSRSYESPLPKGAPYLGDPAQIVEPQNEFVIRKDAGAVNKDRWVEKRFKRDVSMIFFAVYHQEADEEEDRFRNAQE